jgi:hypothetical protein
LSRKSKLEDLNTDLKIDSKTVVIKI